jgi:hypothetical protein
MNVFENYNTASQKYGLEIVNQMSKLGLPRYKTFRAFAFLNVR